ncbi:hypothetical protein [Pseudoalteromonas tunicata]|jgi:hypothetical protein|uniref:Uncharacterized protein n=1 Tax=Pseudoalteromonas tunicata D2 TaxID=87626 RepID=A4C653_9GAMM|nr:hypothetical protein [Pseudoalteromonas tunicata]ATC95430.1 hypothetical protein PTUN_a3039 [Pseudoalteromonas tunicata]AXT31008.1 hypothetical protein D1819_09530 [Pseudoalteromonas tunicata]EAR29457.1 hypothetical protein PTD2_11594 [Pseudoalteromonas tunicata D2]MDP4985715.1 hypothetical protein [Pseudoalteromonas tunicata]MDP5212997.1 hypothetical protein [Pseudoalteromonas tunicata]
MANVFDAMNKLYPQLNRINVSGETEQVNEADIASLKQKLAEPLAQLEEIEQLDNVAVTKQRALQSHTLKPLDNTVWLRSLNKITSGLISSADDEPQMLMFLGVNPKVGNTTISYYATRLLSSYDSEKACIFFSIKLTKQQTSPIFQALVEKNKSVDEFINELEYCNFTEVCFDINLKDIQSAGTLSIISSLLAVFKQDYRWVIVDMPSVAQVPSFLSLFHLADGVVLISKSGETRLPALNALIEDLEECGANIIGSILNFRTFPIPRFLMKFI